MTVAQPPTPDPNSLFASVIVNRVIRGVGVLRQNPIFIALTFAHHCEQNAECFIRKEGGS